MKSKLKLTLIVVLVVFWGLIALTQSSAKSNIEEASLTKINFSLIGHNRFCLIGNPKEMPVQTSVPLPKKIEPKEKEQPAESVGEWQWDAQRNCWYRVVKTSGNTIMPRNIFYAGARNC